MSFFALMLTLSYFSCERANEIDAAAKSALTQNSIVGKWSPTYMQRSKLADGLTFGPWERINTFAPLPVIEFTSSGRFLRDGQDGADCCSSGSTFVQAGKVINFGEKKSCPTVKCASCPNWQIEEIKGDTLVLNECSVISKYLRTK